MSLGTHSYVQDQGIAFDPTAGSVLPQQMVSSARVATRASSLAFAGVATVLLGLWGAIVAFIGPTFGFSADGSWAWDMTSAHLWLGLIPGAAAFVAGLVILMVAPRTVAGGGRGPLVLAGLCASIAGAWFVVGPLAWPVLTTAAALYLSAEPLRELVHQVGYAAGPGVLIAIAGAFTIGWSSRHFNSPALRPASPRRAVHSAVVTPTPVAGRRRADICPVRGERGARKQPGASRHQCRQ